MAFFGLIFHALLIGTALSPAKTEDLDTSKFFKACLTGDKSFFGNGTISADLVRAVDAGGKTCLHLAAANNHCLIVELMVQHTACNEDARVNGTGETALMIAAKNGNLRCFRSLIQYRPPLLAQDKDGYTALHHAAVTGSIPIVRTLAETKDLLNVKTKDGATALILAVAYRHHLSANELITAGADVKVAESKGRTALHFAANHGAKNLMLRLINKGSDVNAGSSVATPLLSAISANQTDAALLLLNKNADAKAVNKLTNQSALFMALERGNAQLITTLINNGADMTSKGVGGTTLMILAAEKGLCGIVKTLAERTNVVDINNMTNDRGENALFVAVNNEQEDCVTTLLEKKVEVNRKQKEGYTPLHAVVRTGDKKVLRALLKAGADPSIMDSKGRTPFAYSLQRCNRIMAHELIRQNVSFVNHPNFDTPFASRNLAMAAMCDYPEIVKQLIAKGADINGRDWKGRQALHVACSFKREKSALALIEAGAKINDAIERNNKTPLYYCSLSGATDVVRRLLKKGANLTVDERANPLLIAAFFNRTKTVMALIENGFKVNSVWKDNEYYKADGETALHFAARNANRELVTKLIEAGADLKATNAKNQTPADVASKANGVADLIKTAMERVLRSGAVKIAA